ncbi:hypothetical protein B0H13DRAFT_802849 [Mycena leptocephala]|nr:hypothetical protein B0H13DRAFT_802849 [Mycena leptocephala]
MVGGCAQGGGAAGPAKTPSAVARFGGAGGGGNREPGGGALLNGSCGAAPPPLCVNQDPPAPHPTASPAPSLEAACAAAGPLRQSGPTCTADSHSRPSPCSTDSHARPSAQTRARAPPLHPPASPASSPEAARAVVGALRRSGPGGPHTRTAAAPPAPPTRARAPAAGPVHAPPTLPHPQLRPADKWRGRVVNRRESGPTPPDTRIPAHPWAPLSTAAGILAEPRTPQHPRRPRIPLRTPLRRGWWFWSPPMVTCVTGVHAASTSERGLGVCTSGGFCALAPCFAACSVLLWFYCVSGLPPRRLCC